MANDYRYEIVIYWSEEDKAFIAEVPELPGCAADGATYADALANVDGIIPGVDRNSERARTTDTGAERAPG